MLPQSKDNQYSRAVFATDVLAGAISLFVIIPVAMAIGGFSFIEPWLIVIPAAMLITGIARGGSFGNIWIKAVAMAIPGWLLVVATASGDTTVHSAESKLSGMLTFASPVVLGIWLRRLRTRSTDSKVDIKR